MNWPDRDVAQVRLIARDAVIGTVLLEKSLGGGNAAVLLRQARMALTGEASSAGKGRRGGKSGPFDRFQHL